LIDLVYIVLFEL